MTDIRVPQDAAEDESTLAFAEDGRDGPAGASDAGTSPAASWGWFRWGWRQLTSMRTALVLLFLLALGSVPGSVLPQQGQDPAAVQAYFTSHPALAPWLSRLGLFNTFAAPWFAAIYLLLFASLVGCVVPRTFRLAGQARTPPPRAPRNLSRLPHSASYAVGLPPAQAVAAAAAILGGKRFRLRHPAGDDQGSWVSAEKGYLREVGNLLFHLALLGVLVSIAIGGLFGYKADKLMVEGQTFADTVSALDEFHPGRLVSGSDLAPFQLTLNKFSASYYTSGESRGQPSSFDAQVSYSPSPGAAGRPYDIRINQPLNVDSVKVYLIGHGYAPEFTVTNASGKVVYDEATPFIPVNTGTFLSDGVVKVPDAGPDQLGFIGVFVPTGVTAGGFLESAFPAPYNPAVSLLGYAGNLGINTGIPQSVFQLDTSAMTKITDRPFLLQPGQSFTLPGGRGKFTFTGYKQWVSLAVTYDPGQVPALVCGILALAGLLLSFLVRRRRVFVRAMPAGGSAATGSAGTGSAGPDGAATGSAGTGSAGPGSAATGDARSVITVGGLARTDASGGFEDEFAELVAQLKAAHDVEAQRSSETQRNSGGRPPEETGA
jgi:cytochrome c biogenesis protein